jgi:hypothetical protein
MTRINGVVARLRTRPRDLQGRPAPHECVRCGAPTAHGKRYCSAHVLGMPYAARLVRELERVELAAAPG